MSPTTNHSLPFFALDIKCMETGTTSSFMAVLSLPLGYNAIPVFEDRPNVDPTINTACRMIPTQLTNDMFQLIVSDLERCGVSKCRQPTGEVNSRELVG